MSSSARLAEHDRANRERELAERPNERRQIAKYRRELTEHVGSVIPIIYVPGLIADAIHPSFEVEVSEKWEEAEEKWDGEMEKAIRTGKLTVRNPVTLACIDPKSPSVDDAWVGNACVSLTDLMMWLQSAGGVVAARLDASLSPSAGERSSIPAKHVPRSQHHEQQILGVIKSLGLDPQALPPYKPGSKGGVKKLVRSGLPYTKDVFNKAWQRLRKKGAIS